MTEEDFIDFKCPHCGTDVSFLGQLGGTAQGCPQCMESVIVPEHSAEAGKPLPTPLTTPRLLLRRFEAHDWKDLLELMSDEELFRFIDGHPLDEEQVLRWIETDQTVRLTQPGQSLFLAIETPENQKVVGYVRLFYSDETHRQAGIHVLINRQHHRKGYGTEALRAVLGFGFWGIGLHRVSASCDSRNEAGCAMLQKAGLRREGEGVEDRWRDGEWVSTSWYAILAREFQPRG